MDNCPKIPEQLSWLERRMEGITGAERIWDTVWRLKSIVVKEAVEKMLLAEPGSKIAYSWK